MKKIYLSFFTAFLLQTASVNAQQVVFNEGYATGVSFVAFGSTNNNVSISTAEAHSGASSLKITLAGSGNYSGGRLETSSGLNLTAYNALSFWIKASKSATFNLAGFGNSSAGNNYNASQANIPLTTAWKKVTIPIPNAARLTSERGLFQFSEGQDEGTYSVYVDDIQFENVANIGTPTVSFANETAQGFIGEAVTNTNAVTAVYPVDAVNTTFSIGRRYLDFTVADPTVASLSNGGTLITPTAEGSTTVTGELAGIPATGTITLSVYPTTAGPAQPTTAAANIQSLFSDTYTNLPVTTWSLNTTRASVRDVSVNGNSLKRYFFSGTTTNYVQIQFPALDVSSRAYLHLQVYTNTSTVFQVKLVNGSAQEFNYNVVTNLGGLPLMQWKSIFIPLSAFSGVSLTNVNQILITASSGSTVYLDNVLFTSVTPLPVRLSSFTANKTNEGTLLKWMASDAENFEGFVMERSVNATSWQTLSFVKAESTTSAYSFVDNRPTGNDNYYRLRLLDKDGAFRFSHVLRVNYGKDASTIRLYPNPVQSQLNIELSSENAIGALLQVVAANGMVVRSENLPAAMANSTFSIILNDLPKGMYFLRLVSRNESTSRPFIKE